MCYQKSSKTLHYAIPYTLAVCALYLISRKANKDHTEPINFKLLPGVIRKYVSSLLYILKEHCNPFLQRKNNKTNEWINLLILIIIIIIKTTLAPKLKCFSPFKASLGYCDYICSENPRSQKLLCCHFILCSCDLQTTIGVHLHILFYLACHRLALSYQCNFQFSQSKGKYAQLFKQKF